ncbi:MAG: DUF1926 domain-containing protein [Chloroflexi bacterium]|nr:DUF1926 domain-containing protein [Chloroflexota bacterium]
MSDAQMFLGLAIHNHQPVGNFPSVLERAYQQAYLPMVEALERHPAVRLSLHYSGPLIDWLVASQPGFLRRVTRLVAQGQVEIVGGAYYEPVLPVIPEADRVGQTRMMGDFCAREFGRRPTGFWLAERVWEPDLPASLSRSGVLWTVVDDTHFKAAGLDDRDLFGYYLTEDQGYALKVFPTSKFLRYAVPFKLVEEVIEYLRANAARGTPALAVMGDDGEKFGVWPKTYEHCWGKDGWIERFFTTIEENQAWLRTIPLGEYAETQPALGRSYLPCASYDEMLEWALPAEKSAQFARTRHDLEAQGRSDVVGFMRGGYWRHFLVKYPEINWMHKKMLRVHEKVYRAARADKKQPGLDDLWRGQCNCAYWHGIFGGLYLSDLRAATYRHLVEAERLADKALHRSTSWLTLEKTDVDNDGNEELLIDGAAFGLALSPARGGSLVEWDLHRPSFNVLSAVARRPEAYHQDLAGTAAPGAAEGTRTIHAAALLKDARAARLLSYDRYPRHSLLDHFLAPDTGLDQFATSYEDLGDFAGGPYEASVVEQSRAKLVIAMSRKGSVLQAGQAVPVSVTKTLALEGGKESFRVRYRLQNSGETRAAAVFGVEWNLNLLGGGHNDQAYYETPGFPLQDWHLDSAGALPRLGKVILGNRYLGIRLELLLEPEAEVWRFPVETASNSEAGIEGLYQASCLLVRLPFELEPQQETGITMTWSQE